MHVLRRKQRAPRKLEAVESQIVVGADLEVRSGLGRYLPLGKFRRFKKVILITTVTVLLLAGLSFAFLSLRNYESCSSGLRCRIGALLRGSARPAGSFGVTIIAPQNGAVIKGSTVVQATTADDSQVVKLEFYIDGKLAYTAHGAPFCLGGFDSKKNCKSWDSAIISDGSHSLLAKAYAKSRATGEEGVIMNVANSSRTLADTTPPTVTIEGLTGGQKVAGVIRVKVAATDDQEVVWTEVYIDKVLYVSAATENVSFNWNTGSKNVASGTHTIMAISKDVAGNTGRQTITVTK